MTLFIVAAFPNKSMFFQIHSDKGYRRSETNNRNKCFIFCSHETFVAEGRGLWRNFKCLVAQGGLIDGFVFRFA